MDSSISHSAESPKLSVFHTEIPTETFAIGVGAGSLGLAAGLSGAAQGYSLRESLAMPFQGMSTIFEPLGRPFAGLESLAGKPITEALPKLADPKMAELLPPLMILAPASYALMNLGKSTYDFAKGDALKVNKDLKAVNEGIFGTIGSIAGYGLAVKFGIPKWIGTSAGLAAGDILYKSVSYLENERKNV